MTWQVACFVTSVFKAVFRHHRGAPHVTSETHPQRCGGFCALHPTGCALRWKWNWLCASCSAPHRPGRAAAKTPPTFWSGFRVSQALYSLLTSCHGCKTRIDTIDESALLIIHLHNATPVLRYYQDTVLNLAESFSIPGCKGFFFLNIIIALSMAQLSALVGFIVLSRFGPRIATNVQLVCIPHSSWVKREKWTIDFENNHHYWDPNAITQTWKRLEAIGTLAS